MAARRTVPLVVVTLSALVLSQVVPLGIGQATEPARSLEECASESENGQRRARAKRLLEARDEFRRCAQDVCPAPIATFCFGRLGEVERALPTVVVQVRDRAGADLADFDVVIDGVLATKADGRSIEFDPGPHTVVARRSTMEGQLAAATPSTTIVVVEGEKHRVVILGLRAPPVASPPPSPPLPPPRTSVLPWILLAAGAVSLGGAAAFWASALDARADALAPGGCAPRCSDDVRDSIRTQILAGDGLAILGLAGIGVAAWLFLRPAARAPQLHGRNFTIPSASTY